MKYHLTGKRRSITKQGDVRGRRLKSESLDELGPYTKNPLIVKVLNELHFVEDLGSGRRNLKRYAPLYYPDYKIEISNGNQFEFSITYDDLSRSKANEIANNTENQHNTGTQSQNETPNEIAVYSTS